MIRQPIVTIVGHVDHGKSSILDIINKTSVVKYEAGGITQKISSSIISSGTIKKICKSLITTEVKIPGLLFIDTPGHAAFNNLRKRGGNLADIAVLVIDINEGLKPQTIESIEILKSYKTPFIIALNKIDLINGWNPKKHEILINNINLQADYTKEALETKLYEIVSKLFDLGFESERFDRITDYTKQIALIPCSAKTGEGIPELLMLISGLSQKYLEKDLEIEENNPGRGTILEIKREKGMGIILDVILYDGIIRKGDPLIIGGINEPIITKVKGIFEQRKDKLKPINEVGAASCIKISAVDIDEAISGMPIRIISDIEKDKKEIRKEVEEVLLEIDDEGIIIKADSLGSLEALISLLRQNNIKIKKALIGDISKKDISEASAEKNQLNKIIVGFNVKTDESSKEVKIIINDIIYAIVDAIKEWQEEQQKLMEAKELEELPKLVKIKILQNCIFRQSNPAVVGVDILRGKLKIGTPLFKDSKEITKVKSMQLEQESISEAETGKEVAISLPDVTVGRQIKAGDMLYTALSEQEFRKLKELKRFLNRDEIEILKEIAEIKRKENKLWGV